MTNLNDNTEKYGIRINVKKTKIRAIEHKQRKKVKSALNGQRTEEVDQYLGSTATNVGKCSKEIIIRMRGA